MVKKLFLKGIWNRRNHSNFCSARTALEHIAPPAMLSPGNSSIVRNHPPTICQTNSATLALWLNRAQIKSCNKTAKQLRKTAKKLRVQHFSRNPEVAEKLRKKLRKTAKKKLRVQFFVRSRPRSCRKTAKNAENCKQSCKNQRTKCACNICTKTARATFQATRM